MKKALLTATILAALTAVGCSDYVMAPEEFRSDAEHTVTPPPQPRVDIVKDAPIDTPRRGEVQPL